MIKDHLILLLEDLDSQQKLTIEMLQSVLETQTRHTEQLTLLTAFRDENLEVKPLVKEHEQKIKNHERRLSKLEMPAGA